MRTQAMAAAKTKATRSRKAASTKKAASAAKAPAKAKKGKTTGKGNGAAVAAKTSSRGARSAAGSKGNGAVVAAKTSNRGTRSAAGSKGQARKSQAAKTGKSSQRRVGKSQQRRNTGSGKSSQSGAAPQRQGETTMSPQAHVPMFGGTKQVLIEEVAMSNRGGRKQGPEPYPFGELTPSRMDGGAIHGPSFFIPESENPKRIIAAGRKRHKGVGKVFLTRQMEGPSIDDPTKKVSGTRVWLAPAGYNE